MFKILISASLALLMTACDSNSTDQIKSLNVLTELKSTSYGDKYSVIAHAGGGVVNGDNAYSYTNSLEALNTSICDGKKLIELDLIVTSDNVIVAGHYWSHSKSILGYQGEDKATEDPLSLSEFKSLKIHGKYTPLDINDINDIFEANKDLILVTDKIRNHDLLLNQFKHHDRLIVECFGLESCLEAKNKGINNIAFNINISDTKVVDDFIVNYSSIIPMVTFNAKTTKNNTSSMDNAKKLLNSGVVNLVYSSNDGDFIKNQIGVSASAFYTDFWSLESQSCIAQSERCVTY